jgi:signal transduction histidine kinase/CheY-like chemotaxis protein
MCDELLVEIHQMFCRNCDKDQIYKLILGKCTTCTKSRMGFIGEYKTDMEHNPFLRILSHSLTDSQISAQMKNFCQRSTMDGFCFTSLKNIFGELLKSTEIIYQDEKKFKKRNVALVEGHPKITNFIGIPIRICTETKLCIVLCNFSEPIPRESFDRLRKIALSTVFAEKILSESIKCSVFEDIINEFDGAIAICETVKKNNKINFNNYFVTYWNDKMDDYFGGAQIYTDKKYHLLRDMAPSFIKIEELYQAILKTIQSKEIVKVSQIKFHDKYIPDDTYDITFTPLSDLSFMILIRIFSTSEEIREHHAEVRRTKQDFVKNMSHEIRTPLNAIRGMSDLLKYTPLNSEQIELVDYINESCFHLIGLVNDILDFSKLEANQVELFEEPMNIVNCVEKCFEIIAIKAKEKGLQLGYYLDEDVPKLIVSDFQRIMQVLVNLLTNAIKFTNKGNVSLSVRLGEEGESTPGKLDDPNYVCIAFEVHDTGIGIKAEDMPKLFQSFSQVDQSNTKNYQGTGLGLAISKHIAQLLHGDIKVRSRPKIGSTFTFTITVKKDEITPENTLDNYKKLLKDCNVLIVDDNAVNRLYIINSLTRLGMRTMPCSSSKEALVYCSNNVYDFHIALIDIRMPEMDGFELARRIKGIDPKMPLIALSSIGDFNDWANKGFDEFLVKPVKLNKLIEKMVTCLKLEDATVSSASISNYFESDSDSDVDLNILVAEDLPLNQKVVVSLLNKLGQNKIKVVENGFEVLHELNKNKYHLLFLDLKMPKMDGYKCFKRMCRKFGKERPYVIALTASAMASDRAKCMAAGMDDYISKPIDLKILDSLLAKFINKYCKKESV